MSETAKREPANTNLPIPIGGMGGIPMSIEFGDRLRAARKDVMISAEFLSRAVGVSEKTFLAWESGRAVPNAKEIMRLCEVSAISSRWLLEGKLPMRKPDKNSDLELIEIVNELARSIRMKKFLTGRIADLRKRLPSDWAADISRAALTPEAWWK